MKILLDSCVWGRSQEEIRAAGHEVIWCGDWTKDPGDNEILAYAYQEKSILVTLDKDFGELAIVFGHPHAGIVRLVNIPARQQATTTLFVVERYGEHLREGAIVTIDKDKIRIRMP
ncbi:MAG TPA: DUF5615 family PIN-like protein [Anaerolineales bacterium]|nr:DUF5615 family PIN-like protein [Anaerolineales bacterium]